MIITVQQITLVSRNCRSITITASLQQSETLRQSILKKAFEGGLV